MTDSGCQSTTYIDHFQGIITCNNQVKQHKTTGALRSVLRSQGKECLLNKGVPPESRKVMLVMTLSNEGEKWKL
jgi:hypothetical protein